MSTVCPFLSETSLCSITSLVVHFPFCFVDSIIPVFVMIYRFKNWLFN